MVKSEADQFLLRVGERLRSAREAAGYSLRSAASKLDITHGAIGHWEKAVNAIDLRTLFTLAKMYGVSVHGLLADQITDGDALDIVKQRLELAHSRAAAMPDLIGQPMLDNPKGTKPRRLAAHHESRAGKPDPRHERAVLPRPPEPLRRDADGDVAPAAGCSRRGSARRFHGAECRHHQQRTAPDHKRPMQTRPFPP